ncbi:uncharacterized protein LOC107816213 [Nicotiana tabacum]|uniref:Uncharacterized protein LOC107816213 n=2 Tax=Nicotiana TaxID=4085 RepID=A0A1S4C8D7_TOBAC|nr:PREDICTED: uncharacterized protein LOC104227164 [Nicotiana sylvestris]XP_016497398.1 PREDICTED: uncharacterized protein LOC107816213 [Nicotiana tabacum]
MGKEKTLSKSRTMTPKMVANFRRSLSFPNHPNHSNKPKKTFHVRSASLPCRSHPLISQLKDDLNELKSWAKKPENRTSAWLCDGLNQLKIVHESLDDLLQLPQTRESLHGHSDLVEKLLDDFLHFVDVYGIFQTLILTFKEEHLTAQVAVRRKDESKIASYAKALRKMAKEMEKLVSNVQCMGKYIVPQQCVAVPDGDAELAEVMKDIIEVTELVSIALFNGLGVSMAFPKPTCSWIGLGKKIKKVKENEGIVEFIEMGLESLLWGLRKKGDEEVKMVSKKMHELEDCICGIESGGEKVFRSLLNARVSLLNVFTQ